MECLVPYHEFEFNYCRQIENLIVVVQELSLAQDLQKIMDIVKVSARRLSNSDGATFILKEGENCYYADEDAIAPLWKGKRFPLSICIGGWTMNNRQSAIIADVSGDNRIPYEAYRPTFVRSLLTAPIRQSNPIGAIGIYWANYHEPTAEEIKLLQALADSTAIAMENVQVYQELEERVAKRTEELAQINAQLQAEIIQRQQAEEEIRQLSLRDELTQLYNRRGFYVLGQHELEIAKRHHQYCTLFFIDLDGLKKANDFYGHEVGDQMIKDMAILLQKTFRSADVVCRLGGDEFVVLTASEENSNNSMHQRLMEHLSHFNHNSSRQYQLAFSVGCVRYYPESQDTLDTLLMQGDAQMYIQKKAKKEQNESLPNPTHQP